MKSSFHPDDTLIMSKCRCFIPCDIRWRCALAVLVLTYPAEVLLGTCMMSPGNNMTLFMKKGVSFYHNLLTI